MEIRLLLEIVGGETDGIDYKSFKIYQNTLGHIFP